MIKQYLVIWLFSMVVIHHTKCQKEGDTWMIGYATQLSSARFSVMHLEFASGDLNLKLDYNEKSRFQETSSSISDSNAVPLLWTNGMQVRGKGNVDVLDTIAYEPGQYSYWKFWFSSVHDMPFGFPVETGALIIPDVGNTHQSIIVYHIAGLSHEVGGWLIKGWLHAKVEHKPDDTFTTIYKDSLFSEKLEWFSYGLNAVRHANGRDWWLITFEWESSKYFAYLLDSSGIHLDHEGDVGGIVKGGLGQTVISPKGNFIGRTDTGPTAEGQSVTLFSFDRCVGEVRLLPTFHLGYESFKQGVAFSPSEQYFYVTALNRELWQFDLWSEDIPSSQTLVGAYDGFVDPGPTGFGPMMQTPDGRLYVVAAAGSSEYLHVIDRPDLPAADCRFLQHHIDLTVSNARSAPNIPNYRLGPLDGSPCDTLGLNNMATSRWRYEPNIEYRPLAVRFTDLSFYEPTAWHWDFGDGQTSEEISPIHEYSEYGLYHVCQTVSNEYAQDSTCRWVEIMPYTSSDDPMGSTDLALSPNPFTNQLRIESQSGIFRSAQVCLLDLQGQIVFSTGEIPVPVTIKVPDLLAGMYICRIQEEDGEITSLKVVKQ